MRTERDGFKKARCIPPTQSTALKVPRFSRSTMMRLQAGLIVFIALLNIADGALTYLGLTFFEVYEANPVLDLFSSRLGLGSAIVFIKAIILSGLLLLFFRRSCARCITNITTLALTNVFYLWVVGNNTDLIFFHTVYH